MHTSPSNGPIGVFDSGLGGISVLREIRQLLPHEHLLYVADSGHAPYGNKTSAYIVERCLRLSEFLLEQGAKAIVVACNTATAHAIEHMRAHLTAPVIGIEPAVKPAVRLTRSGVVGVLATLPTVQSYRLQRLIQEHAGSVKVLAQACPGLVEHVEQGDFDSPALRALLLDYIKPLLAQGSDTLVLGCTHYPFLSQTLQQLVGSEVHILEPSRAVAHQLLRVLEQRGLLNSATTLGKEDFYSSKTGAHHQYSMQLLWQHPLDLKALPVQFI